MVRPVSQRGSHFFGRAALPGLVSSSLDSRMEDMDPEARLCLATSESVFDLAGDMSGLGRDGDSPIFIFIVRARRRTRLQGTRRRSRVVLGGK